MSPRARAWLGAAGYVVFAAVLAYALYASPPSFARIEPLWIALAALVCAISIGLQAAQVAVFLSAENVPAGARWLAWFTAEKAWVNTLVPARAGTGIALVLLRARFGIPLNRYVRFMLRCGLLAAAASAAAALVLVVPAWPGWSAGALVFAASAVASRILYPTTHAAGAWLALNALLSLVALGAGIGACLAGLGYVADLHGVAAVGTTLNLLSIASITPGNFGVREAVLSALTPVIPIPFPAVIQASTCYVLVRLLITLATATLLRSESIAHRSAPTG